LPAMFIHALKERTAHTLWGVAQARDPLQREWLGRWKPRLQFGNL
jgi:hypothetical protein